MPQRRDGRATSLRELTRAAGAAYVDTQEGRTVTSNQNPSKKKLVKKNASGYVSTQVEQ